MGMYNQELKEEIHMMFQELEKKAENIADTSRTSKLATERISEMVASKVAAESEGYIVDMYTCLTAKVKADEYFEDPEHLNAFYRLNLREKLDERYHFEVNSLETYKKGIEFKEVSELYAAAGAVAGTLAVGGILKFAISSFLHIPIAVILAGAVLAGVSVYFSIPNKNRTSYKLAVNKFLKDMENEILDWLAEVENYFESQVRSLYRT